MTYRQLYILSIAVVAAASVLLLYAKRLEQQGVDMRPPNAQIRELRERVDIIERKLEEKIVNQESEK